MTPEKIQIAMAEVCEWKRTEWADVDVLPDYPNDLNAVHEAEEMLTPEQRVNYSYHLSQLIPQNENCGPFEPGGPDLMVYSAFDLIHATALQRCEAFLRTVGKWEDDSI